MSTPISPHSVDIAAGVERYVVLVEGKGSPDGNYLLDIEEAKPSAMVPHLARDQLRASGRAGAANADDLIAFAQRGDWGGPMLDAALEMTLKTGQQWQAFVKASKA